MDLKALYKDIILEHSRDPRNFHSLLSPQLSRHGHNPLCGDQIVLEINLDDSQKRVTECAFTGQGCSICLASASILTEEMEDCPIDEALQKVADFRSLMKGEKEASEFSGDVSALAGVRDFPVRIKCALLAWVAAGDALNSLESGKGEPHGVSKTE